MIGYPCCGSVHTDVHLPGCPQEHVRASETWEQTWMGVAERFAQRSKDLSTKVGCVIVGPDQEQRSMGVNGIPRGVRDIVERMERPAKYLWTSHAEENAVAQAARVGVSLKGCTVYSTHLPCARCARLLIQAGIVKVVFGSGLFQALETEGRVTETMFSEAGIATKRFT